MNLRINGEYREVVNDISVKELLIQLDLTADRIAIELNQKVVRRADFSSTVLKENDQVEIVHFVGGGEEMRQEAGGRSRRKHFPFVIF